MAMLISDKMDVNFFILEKNENMNKNNKTQYL